FPGEPLRLGVPRRRELRPGSGSRQARALGVRLGGDGRAAAGVPRDDRTDAPRRAARPGSGPRARSPAAPGGRARDPRRRRTRALSARHAAVAREPIPRAMGRLSTVSTRVTGVITFRSDFDREIAFIRTPSAK